MLKKILAAAGVGAASVDARFDTTRTTPGGRLRGQIHLQGGSVEQEIRSIEIRVETHYIEEHDDHKFEHSYALGGYRLPEIQQLKPGDRRQLPFEIEIPLTAPLTLGGQRVWIRTSLEVEMGIDPKDIDAIQVDPTPLQQRLLDALGQLGFQAVSARCEKSRLGRGVPFVQEIEMRPRSGAFRGRLDELDVVMLPEPGGLGVILEMDRKARGLGSWLAEMADMDETKRRLRFSSADLSSPLGTWANELQRVIASGA